MQGGKIGLRSIEGEGSTFAFYIKAKHAQAPLFVEDLISKKRPAGTGGMSPGSHPPKMRAVGSLNRAESIPQASSRRIVHYESISKADYHVLLVEDNELNQKVLAKQLRKAGCTVAVANHGQEAIDYLLRMNDQPIQFGSSDSQPLMPYLDCVLMDWEM